jgi:hypothetical protein
MVCANISIPNSVSVEAADSPLSDPLYRFKEYYHSDEKSSKFPLSVLNAGNAARRRRGGRNKKRKARYRRKRR